MTLADLGAQVIKVECPDGGDDTRQWGPPWAGGESAYYISVNRNKKSITLNLNTDHGRQITRSLACKADVLIENFKVGSMQNWGLSYEDLHKENPRLIYCSISGYGQSGPKQHQAGYDFVIQAEGGIMSINGEVDGRPMKVGVAIVDITAGMNAVIAIQAALYEREKSGLGQHIDIALLDSQVAWLANVASNYHITGERPKRYANAHPNIVPYETFSTADGWIAVAVGNDRQWKLLCDTVGWDDLAKDERFKTNPLRVEHRDALIPILNKRFGGQKTESWHQLLSGVGIPCAPINSIDQVFADPQVLARQMLVEMPHPTAGSVKLTGSPLKLSRTPVQMASHPPLLGEHTDEVLRDYLGYTPDEVMRLQDNGVI
jgi:formyl-CoA transferase